MSDNQKTYPSHLTIRLSPEEWELLERAAGRMSYSAYIRKFALGEAARKRRDTGKKPDQGQEGLSRALSLLGIMAHTREFDGMAKAAQAGTLILTEEQFQVIVAAGADIRLVKEAMLKYQNFRKIYE